jgi:hypothetical protein
MPGDEFLDYWDVWGLDIEEFNEILNNNENAYSGMFGYVAEVRLREQFFENDERISNLGSPRDHDRSEKGDIVFEHEGEEIRIEVKSLNTQKGDIAIREDLDGETVYEGTVQVMASDRREIEFPDGTTTKSSLLEVGEFDILAVNMFEYFMDWKFMFIKNEDISRSPTHDRLLKSNPNATYPTNRSPLPYSEDPFELIEDTISSEDETDKVGLEIEEDNSESSTLDDFI